MVTFLVCLSILIGGYFIYGTYVDRMVGVNPDKETPKLLNYKMMSIMFRCRGGKFS